MLKLHTLAWKIPHLCKFSSSLLSKQYGWPIIAQSITSSFGVNHQTFTKRTVSAYYSATTPHISIIYLSDMNFMSTSSIFHLHASHWLTKTHPCSQWRRGQLTQHVSTCGTCFPCPATASQLFQAHGRRNTTNICRRWAWIRRRSGVPCCCSSGSRR